MDHLKADIIIAGGGPAGVTAAITAARLNTSVILVTNRPVLGGNSSSEIRVWCRGATGGGNLFAEEMGIWGELKLRNLYTNPLGNPIFWDEVLLDKVLGEKNISLLLNTQITSVQHNQKEILSISGFQLFTEKQIQITGKIFIDATGDAFIGANTDLDYQVNQISKNEYEHSSPKTIDQNGVLGSSILYYTKKLDSPVRFVKPEYAYDMDHIEELINHGGRIISEKYSGSDYWWFECGGTTDTIRNSQEITFELKKLVYGVWNYIKNSGKYEADNLTLEWVGNIPGKRESRRMVTDYVIKEEDVFSHRLFEDGAFYGGWFMDNHPSEGIHADEEACIQVPVSIYDIPLRCLFNSDVQNLVFAGRNIGTAHGVFVSSRIMNTCAQSGQAAGTLASACVRKSCTPKEIVSAHVKEIRQILLKNDMFVLGCRNEDPDDLAHKAEISASSVTSGMYDNQTEQIPLNEGVCFAAPSGEAFSLLIDSTSDCLLHMNVYEADVPSRYNLEILKTEIRLNLSKGKKWYSLQILQNEKPCFNIFQITGHTDAKIISTDRQVTGFIGWTDHSMNYWYPCLKIDSSRLYRPENIINGFNRIYQQPNLWISDIEVVPSITFKWNNPQIIQEIRFFFNTDLSKELPSSKTDTWADSHKYIPQKEMPVQLVRGFEIYQKVNNEFQQIYKEAENLYRLCTVKLPSAIQTEALMVKFTSTYGAPYVEVFEIRIYRNLQG
ncbi:MAG: FAD-dependent oxidoreductase [Flexilinea sp.]